MFLVDTYKPEFFYFEVIECFRRIFLGSMIGVFGGSNSVAPATVGLVVSMGCIGLFARMEPYKHQSDNNVSAVLAYALSLYFLAALMLKTEATDSSEAGPAVLLFFVFAAGPVAIAFEWFSTFGQVWKAGGATKDTEMMALPSVQAMVLETQSERGDDVSLDDEPKKVTKVATSKKKLSMVDPKSPVANGAALKEMEVLVTVPANVTPGTMLRVQAAGQTLQVTVPPGAPPGSQIRVRAQLPEATF